MKRRCRCLLPILSAVAVASISLSGLLPWLRHVPAPFRERRFDAAVWRRARGDAQKHERARMADDLLRHHLKVGMLQTQVEDLLGAPEKLWYRSSFREERRRAHDVFEYDMGHAP